MLIARIYPVMTVYTVKGGQRKGSKYVINFPQNVSTLMSVLPQLPVDIPLIVRRSDIHEMKHYDFRVRQHKIRDVLQSGMDRVGPGSGQNRSRVGPKLKSGEARDRPGHSDSRDRPARRPIGPAEIWARPDPMKD